MHTRTLYPRLASLALCLVVPLFLASCDGDDSVDEKAAQTEKAEENPVKEEPLANATTVEEQEAQEAVSRSSSSGDGNHPAMILSMETIGNDGETEISQGEGSSGERIVTVSRLREPSSPSPMPPYKVPCPPVCDTNFSLEGMHVSLGKNFPKPEPAKLSDKEVQNMLAGFQKAHPNGIRSYVMDAEDKSWLAKNSAAYAVLIPAKATDGSNMLLLTGYAKDGRRIADKYYRVSRKMCPPDCAK